MLGDGLVLSAPPFGHVPLLDRLAPARDAGFAAISLLPGDVWQLERAGVAAAEVRSRIADHGLAVMELDCVAAWLPAHATAGGDGEMARLLRGLTPERVLDTAVRIGAPSVTVVEMMGHAPGLAEGAEAFAGLCDQAAARGLRVHLEFLPFGGIPDLATAWRIVEAAGRSNGGLTIDSWHFFRSRSAFDLLEQIPGAQVFTVQINDAPAQAAADLMAETMSARMVPGTGSFDLARFVRTLDRIGCTAPLSVEVFSRATAQLPMAEAIAGWADAAHTILDKARTPE